MDTDSNKTIWTVIIVAAVAIMGGLFVNFVPDITSQIQSYVQTVTDNSSGTVVDSDDNSDFSYSAPNETDNTISINGYKGKNDDVTIPTYRKIGSVKYKVTSIDQSAFRQNTSIKRVTIPDGVQTIGYKAFYDDSNLEQVNLGSGVTNIGTDAFSGTALTSINIPDSVQDIGSCAFYDNSNLEQVTLGSGLKYIGDSAFSGTALTSINIPDSVQDIGTCAFYHDSLKSLTLGSGVTNIGGGAFANTALTKVDFPASLKSIGDNAFADTPLSSISFKSPVDLDWYAFKNTKLTNVTLPKGSSYNTDQTHDDMTFDPTVTVTVK